MYLYELYRAMNLREYKRIRRYGFEGMFLNRKEKHFTPNEEYIWIILNTNFYNNIFKRKYDIVLYFLIESSKKFEKKVVDGRFVDVTIRREDLKYIQWVEFLKVPKDSLRRPEPIIVFKNKGGKIRVIYRFAEIQGSKIRRKRIIWENPLLRERLERYLI